ncbi:hypothetical protein [Pseudofrankia sp. DC12]|uniref:hypothetical protein n=1 Tax=Pseudofrankia sp. DC12 TaxID=683315 RepID=UPI0005F77DCD|nr:hypothetical protein [Pseudofrankia sp. DC12]
MARTGADPAFTATFTTYSAERARLSWIRAAYLSAFALFGWRYILSPTLQPIRDALAERGGNRLPPLSFSSSGWNDDRRELWIVREPTDCQSLLSVWGREGIFLPLPFDNRGLGNLSRRLGGEAAAQVNFTFKGGTRSWPIGPEHGLDPPPVFKAAA